MACSGAAPAVQAGITPGEGRKAAPLLLAYSGIIAPGAHVAGGERVRGGEREGASLPPAAARQTTWEKSLVRLGRGGGGVPKIRWWVGQRSFEFEFECSLGDGKCALLNLAWVQRGNKIARPSESGLGVGKMREGKRIALVTKIKYDAMMCPGEYYFLPITVPKTFVIYFFKE